MIAIIDYGAGNLRSVANAFRYLGANSKTVSSPEGLKDAEKIVLPGVGAFGAGMANLRETGFEEPIKEAAKAGIPLLGICLGLQYLFEWSDEMGRHEGLGLLPGYITRFPEGDPRLAGMKIPHMGWNELHVQRDHPLLKDVKPGSFAYFVHSYYAVPADTNDIVATTDYGFDFASVVARGNVMGIQPHPEKSQLVGLRILRNFVEMERVS